MEENCVRLWWWNPGAGANCRIVHRDDLDVERMELNAMGATTWITDATPVFPDAMPAIADE
jgi:hypothetical protein